MVRFKVESVNSYLTVSDQNVEMMLPNKPDFLKGQIRRMEKNELVERDKYASKNELQRDELN